MDNANANRTLYRARNFHTGREWLEDSSGTVHEVLKEGTEPPCSGEEAKRLLDENARLRTVNAALLAACKAIDNCIVWRDDLGRWTLAPDHGPIFIEKLRSVRAAITLAESE